MEKCHRFKKDKDRAMELVKQASLLSSQESKVTNRCKDSSEVLQKVRFALRRMEKMKVSEFMKLKKETGISHVTEVNEKVA